MAFHRYKKLLVLILPIHFFAINCHQTSLPSKSGHKLIWNDDFDQNGSPDNKKWTYDVGQGGWGNNELQAYTGDKLKNARLSNGNLIIEAHRDSLNGMEYSSARMVSRGLADWTYGYFEIRAKLPSGRGTWPAIWMLGSNIDEKGWPDCGEIDIMEHVGYAPDSLFGTIHSKAFNHVIGTQVGKGIQVDSLENKFHTYAIDWDEKKIQFLINDSVYHQFSKRENATEEEWPFDNPHYLILNLAVGGNWGGKHGVDTTIWPQQFVIDWVRVWKKDN